MPHDPRWAGVFERARASLARALAVPTTCIHHIGSTAVPGILAKPIIDILVEAQALDHLDAATPAMEGLGYEVMGEFGIAGRRYFRKSSETGIRLVHVHGFLKGSPGAIRHLAFRDFLLENPEVAQDYSRLKQRALEDWRGMDAYIAGKAQFVQATERLALEWHGATSSGSAFNPGSRTTI